MGINEKNDYTRRVYKAVETTNTDFTQLWDNITCQRSDISNEELNELADRIRQDILALRNLSLEILNQS